MTSKMYDNYNLDAFDTVSFKQEVLLEADTVRWQHTGRLGEITHLIEKRDPEYNPQWEPGYERLSTILEEALDEEFLEKLLAITTRKDGMQSWAGGLLSRLCWFVGGETLELYKRLKNAAVRKAQIRSLDFGLPSFYVDEEGLTEEEVRYLFQGAVEVLDEHPLLDHRFDRALIALELLWEFGHMVEVWELFERIMFHDSLRKEGRVEWLLGALGLIYDDPIIDRQIKRRPPVDRSLFIIEDSEFSLHEATGMARLGQLDWQRLVETVKAGWYMVSGDLRIHHQYYPDYMMEGFAPSREDLKPPPIESEFDWGIVGTPHKGYFINTGEGGY